MTSKNTPNTNKLVFDTTLYSGKPDPSTWGATAMRLISNSSAALANYSPDTHDGQVCWADIEDQHWYGSYVIRNGFDSRFVPNGHADSQLATLSYHIDRLRRKFPGMRIGFFDVAPEYIFAAPLQVLQNPGNEIYINRRRQWHALNAARRLERGDDDMWSDGGFASRADYLGPCVYMQQDPSEPQTVGNWLYYVESMIHDARKYGRPIYPFVDFHRWTPAGTPPTYLGDDVSALILNTILQLADGAIIWGGWGENGDMATPPRNAWSHAESTWLPVVKDILGY